jgi:hypothetical protein
VAGEECIMRSFVMSTLHHILLGWSNQGGWDGWGMKHERGRWEVWEKFWSENLKGRDHLEGQAVGRMRASSAHTNLDGSD